MPIFDDTQAFRTARTALTASADSSSVRIKGGNLHTPMYALIDYWDAATSAGAGAATFGSKRSTDDSTFVLDKSPLSYSVTLSTTETKGQIVIPICHPDDYTNISLTLTGTGATIKYNAALVSEPPGG